MHRLPRALHLFAASLAFVASITAAVDAAAGPDPEAPLGYYRYPAVSGRTVVFTAEGDLWRVAASRGGSRATWARSRAPRSRQTAGGSRSRRSTTARPRPT